jgi:chromosome segregation ATPase
MKELSNQLLRHKDILTQMEELNREISAYEAKSESLQEQIEEFDKLIAITSKSIHAMGVQLKKLSTLDDIAKEEKNNLSVNEKISVLRKVVDSLDKLTGPFSKEVNSDYLNFALEVELQLRSPQYEKCKELCEEIAFLGLYIRDMNIKLSSLGKKKDLAERDPILSFFFNGVPTRREGEPTTAYVILSAEQPDSSLHFSQRI